MAVVSKDVRQSPEPGKYILTHQGDVINFTLTVPMNRNIRAFVRTNIGYSRVYRREIIRQVEENEPIMARDWDDIPMSYTKDGLCQLALPLTETGRFEAKAYFLESNSGTPVWPDGNNVIIKVEPADYCCLNTIYSTFVRQFGDNVYLQHDSDKRIRELEAEGYSVIPKSGTFRDLIKQLDFILGKLRFRIVQLLPIHPIPTTYGRMGAFGSPFATLDLMDVDPALTEFDRKTTPMDQFLELVDAVHARSGKLFLDIPINHTGWASRLQVDHPEWFVRRKDMMFESPGAWGVTWEDLAELDYSHRELWKHMAEVFLFWCRKGVDGFRCDAGYKVPYPVWEYVAAKVRCEYPDTVFMLEGLGGKTEVTEALLSGANLDWAYSELFQNYDRGQIEHYLPYAINVSSSRGLLVHFAETHDNNRLAAKSETYAKMRTALTALCSHEGAFGITNGVEWFAREKIDVHGAFPLNWGAENNQVEHIARLNAILETQPAFRENTGLRMIQTGAGNSLALLRTPPSGPAVLVLANLNDSNHEIVCWGKNDFPCTEPVDLLSGGTIRPEEKGNILQLWLEPGKVLCLSTDHNDIAAIDSILTADRGTPAAIIRQHACNTVLKLHNYYHPDFNAHNMDLDAEQELLLKDPSSYLKLFAPSGTTNFTAWEWPHDTKRTVPVPGNHFLCLQSKYPFEVEIQHDSQTLVKETCLPASGNYFFSIIQPPSNVGAMTKRKIVLTVFEPNGCIHVASEILYLGDADSAMVQMSFDHNEVMKKDSYAICSNRTGAMIQVRGSWGEVRSQYDAFLAGNLHPNYPVDRHIMFTRCRAWLVYMDYSYELSSDYLTAFSKHGKDSVSWKFTVPSGQGKMVSFDFCIQLMEEGNAVILKLKRKRMAGEDFLRNKTPVKLIVRPDIEDRVSHGKTKAYMGAESVWPNAVSPSSDGFTFTPGVNRTLYMNVSSGRFNVQPEWMYMVHHSIESERGLDGSSDLFSPGYFTVELTGGDESVLTAGISCNGTIPTIAAKPSQPVAMFVPLADSMKDALQDFIVNRAGSKTIIAGFPWFLDWGRDTLIALRGTIAAGLHDESLQILKQFAGLESRGTIPNMLHGGDDANRDTSDAPLWLFVACRDLMSAGKKVLTEKCGERTVLQVLISIAEWYSRGTPNGIRMDPDSGLIFSPSHFTWMDTNHPAGSPREGYPIEIQSLWYSALTLLAKHDTDRKWAEMADRVRQSVDRYFTCRDRNLIGTECIFLSDCLHAHHGQPAAEAIADNALRPNQLLAITLGMISDKTACSGILEACEKLLIPGAIRSLADRPVKHALRIEHRGRLLNDPFYPYHGKYTGDEDTSRKPSYHNGTAWTWPFPSYSEALFMVYGEKSLNTAKSLLISSLEIINRECIGQVPEIVDGNYPHDLRGCGAQAWGVTELFRVLAMLS